jgi:hypothetical protein
MLNFYHRDRANMTTMKDRRYLSNRKDQKHLVCVIVTVQSVFTERHIIKCSFLRKLREKDFQMCSRLCIEDTNALLLKKDRFSNFRLFLVLSIF